MGKQNTKLSYSAVDIESGVEVLGIELRQGLIDSSEAKAQENSLLNVAKGLIDSREGK